MQLEPASSGTTPTPMAPTKNKDSSQAAALPTDSVAPGRTRDAESVDLRAFAATVMGGGRNVHIMWTFDTGDEINHPPSRSPDGHRIYFSSRDGHLYCVDDEGTRQWKTKMPDFIYESTVPAHDGSVIARTDKTLIKLDDKGDIQWQRSFESIQGKPLVSSDGTVWMSERHRGDDGKDKNYLHALEPEKGSTRKSIEMRSDCYDNPVEGADGRIYIVDKEHNLYCITKDGEVDWSRKKPGIGSGKLSTGRGGTLFATDSIPGEKRGDPIKTILFGLNADGSKKMIYDTDSAPLKYPPVEGPDGTLYLNLWHGKDLQAISPQGKLLWHYPLESKESGEATPSIGPDGTIYVADGKALTALNPDGSLLFKEQFEKPLNSAPVFTPDGSACITQDNRLVCLKDHRKFLKDEQASADSTREKLTVDVDESEVNIGGVRLKKQ